MKKILCLTAAIFTLASFTACSSEDGKVTDNSSTGSNGGIVSNIISDVESTFNMSDTDTNTANTTSDIDSSNMSDSDTTMLNNGTVSD